ncbi:hypothetical protein SLEP1_g2040 [Rubroshorea leprosula]|uniref:DIS3-like exonuclease 2 n=1 Tax=Rubroshorea leprosula TaxID=152421 RepID=A0AAV5HG00_9ROSI|nr:hypothetical protein SLEP1_g2040 [Rubroshorea leprosula]
MKSAVQHSVLMVEDADKEKKKKRRSNRRSKQNAGAACGSVNETVGEASENLKSGSETKISTSYVNYASPKQQGSEKHVPNEERPAKASNIAFNSMPIMHINETELGGVSSAQDEYVGDRMFSKSWPEPIVQDRSSGTDTYSFFHSQQIEASTQRKLFVRHWPVEAVTDALEKGEAFKALFRVNAYNRLEAYCKIDGVPTDILISGIVAQNRAIEGDTVVIKVDPFPFWTKMKGSSGSSNNSALAEGNLLPEVSESVASSNKGKGKMNADCENDEDMVEMVGSASYNYVNGAQSSAPDAPNVSSSGKQNDGTDAVGRLAAMVSSSPMKRPTGTVIAIVQKSSRRDAIVGFLNVKQWFSYKKDAKNKSCLSISDHGYIHLTPTDPKFPKMLVLSRDLPESIKKRLEDGDATVQMELVAAGIDGWSEESSFPQACVLHTFGKAGELEPHINAILYENSIICADFSPESLSCLPHIPWEVPWDELQKRKDLRNLCVFTIDPSTATDLDDALSVERLPAGTFRVGVHIADVSYFVLPDTALDLEAQSRSTSVYMSRGKLPMLPQLLSENLGSLDPGVDRLTFSIFWELNSSGNVVDRWIGRTVIRSCCKLSYKNAQDIIDGTVDGQGSHSSGDCPKLHGHFEFLDVVKSVKCLHEISKILKKRRFDDGALQLDSFKVDFLFDELGVPYDSVLNEQTDSNFLVEEFMLLANTTAAEVISRAFPDGALLRRHPEPNLRKLRELEAFCQKNGLELDTSSSGQFHHSLEKLREKLKDDTMLFDILLLYALKPMQLATYFCSGELKDNVDDWGHYGLAVPLYTHFTSPLRRYPDIIVHRMMAAVVDAEKFYLKHLSVKAKHSNEVSGGCFTGICFDKDAAESQQGREALSTAALKHNIPCTEVLAGVAAHCNDRQLASRQVKDACDKLYTWFLLKKREILLSEARVLGLGPKFMSIYIHKLAIERRIYYDDVDGLIVEWLESTSTLVLSLSTHRRNKRGGTGYYRAIGSVALIVNPYDPSVESEKKSACGCGVRWVGDGEAAPQDLVANAKTGIDPGTFPLTLHLLSTISVALDAVGGDDGPLDIRARLYMSSYLR